MTPDERAAAELALNTLISNAVQIAIAIFAVAYFLHKAWVKWRAPVLSLLPDRAPRYVEQPESELTPAPVRSAAFTNDKVSGSVAFISQGTERTEESGAEPGVQIARLSEEDIKHILTALENRGYLCLSLQEQGAARDLVYQIERQARFRLDRSKSSAIEEATGVKRGGSAAYKRFSVVYDALIGQPPPAVEKSMQGEAVRA